MTQNISGLATGIGSLPHTDADAALDLIFKYCPEIPFWPQLPKRDSREGMCAQFSENFPYLSFGPEGLSFSALSAKEGELESFYERIIANDVEYFKISAEFAAGLQKFYQRLEGRNLKDIAYLKGHITGPFTFGASVKDESGAALLHDAVFMQVIIKGLAMKALWQAKLFAKFGKPLIIFIDEPYLGCFGSAYTPLNREDVVRGLSELAGAIKSQGALVGAHCCGNTDWSLFTDVPSLDIISFDAFDFLDKFVLYADSLKGFFKRGGIACWGIVPTQEFSGKEAAAELAAKIKSGIEVLAKKGVERNLLENQLLVSPACGLGTLEPAKAEPILKLLAETSALLKN
jgi:methionine synthase II (cobalamin-independent)